MSDKGSRRFSYSAQSSLEYMMTYGWAMLIIFVVAAVLYAIGIFNPTTSAGSGVTGLAGFNVNAICTSNGVLLVSIANTQGSYINVSSINVTTQTNQVITASLKKVLPPNSVQNASLIGACPSSGSRYSLHTSVTYAQQGSAFSSKTLSSGVLFGTVSSSSVTLLNFTEVGLPSGASWSLTSGGSTNSFTTNTGYVVGSGAIIIGNVTFGGITYYPEIFTLSAGSASRYITFLPDEMHRPLFISLTNKIEVVNASTGALIKNISVAAGANMVAISPVSSSGYVDGGSILSIFNTTTYTSIANISSVGGSGFNGLTISPDGKWLYIVSQGNTIQILSTSNNSIMSGKQINNADFNGPDGVVFTPNNKYMFINNNYGTDGNNANQYIEMYPNGTKIKDISQGSNACVYNTYGFAISPDGKLIFTANANSNCVTVINTTSGSISATINTAGNQGIGVLPDDKTLFIAYNTGVVVYKDTYSAESSSLSLHASPSDVAVSPDGKFIYILESSTLQIINNTASPSIWKTIGLGASAQALSNTPYDYYG